MAKHNDIGQQGEEMARDYLTKKGYKILHNNFRSSNSEVDIVAEWENQLIFVEVKTRSSVSFGQPEIFVSQEKKRHMKKVARGYIHYINFNGEVRFDIISVVLEPQKEVQITHFEDAFFLR